ncbi:hypothetical protein TEA_024628 [Camellia sinensis var. sinensis]|uniref:Uncharacterized protein n=1 Tax=Camellia sinensis var. sinensis TaxID=542762 RepID=A0A4S4EWK1_CAMSN|nr:hypothetical protein TEA_024628 [Camellia sinensis var. sinensis]
MAKIEDNTIISKPRSRTSSCFLGCFGFSGKVKVSEEIPRKKSPRWFSWPRLKKSDAKTVPVDAATAPAGKKITSKHHAPAKIPADSPEQSEHEKLQKTRHETSQNIILEDNKDLDHVSCRYRSPLSPVAVAVAIAIAIAIAINPRHRNYH